MLKIKRSAQIATAIALFLAVGAAPSAAHHSTNLYFDVTKTVMVEGTVTALKLQNPHSQLRFMGKNAKGEYVEWVAETHNAAAMVRLGWKQNTLMPGDKVKVSGNPSRTVGQYALYLLSVVAPNGRTITPNSPVGGATH